MPSTQSGIEIPSPRVLPPEVNADHWAVQLALMEVYAAYLASHFTP